MLSTLLNYIYIIILYNVLYMLLFMIVLKYKSQKKNIYIHNTHFEYIHVHIIIDYD